jgi:hypothetical protein
VIGSEDPVIVFPILSAVISALCAGVIARDALRRPRPDKVVWSIAFVLFALAAGADAAGISLGWSTWLAKTYYATGPALVVAYLAVGQLYLLFPAAMKRFGIGGTMLVTALWLSLVINAPIDSARLSEDGWEAIDRGPEMVAITVLINAVGTLIIVGGTAWSVWRFWKAGTHRNRMIGCALICGGTLAVAAGGSLTRLGHYEYLYIAMSIGVAMIFGGVLVSRRPDRARSGMEAADRSITPAVETAGEPVAVLAPTALAFIGDLLLTRDDSEIERMCSDWSVPRDPAPTLSRSDARRAWKLRAALPAEAIARFDAHPVPVRRQLSTLYHDVLVWERPARDEIAELVSPPSESPGAVRQA